MRITIAVLVIVFAFVHEVYAAQDCQMWNTPEYFLEATVEDVTACMDAGADSIAPSSFYDYTPLHWAAKFNDNALVIKTLLEAGADPMARDSWEGTPLHLAAGYSNNPAIIEALLKAGADLDVRDEDGETPLFYAAAYNPNPAAFQTLLAAGADLKVRSNDGQTLLHAAAHSENPALVELLLKAGVDVNARAEDGETPLHVAAWHSGWMDCHRCPPMHLYPDPTLGSTAVVEALLEAGADVNARSNRNWTPLHWAASSNENPEIVEVLLAAGAEVDARDEDGVTPFDEAKFRVGPRGATIREILQAYPLPSRPVGTDIEDVAVVRDCPTCPELVVVPAGMFQMGCEFGDNDCWSGDNIPTHEVDVASFALSKFEVTRGQFAAFVAATGYETSGGCLNEPGSWRDQSWQSDEHPVVCVNWDDAQAYVQWLAEETGHPYRLPTEAEWEYALRAGTKTRFYWGYRASELCKYVNSRDCDDGWEKTAPVGSLRANRFGLYDMAGNVSEWVEDCWHENYEGAPRDGSAWTRDGGCGRRVVRGGHWEMWSWRSYRSANRDKSDVGFRFFRLGFRVARSLDEP